MRQCLQNDIPLMTYDFTTMDAYEMEEAACRPYRFQHVLESALPRYHRSRVLDLSMPDDIPIDQEATDAIMNVEVIPGGRYIVTTSESGWLRCWDLVGQCE